VLPLGEQGTHARDMAGTSAPPSSPRPSPPPMQPSWLTQSGTPLAQLSPPLSDPRPCYQPDRDAVVAWHDVTYGKPGRGEAQGQRWRVQGCGGSRFQSHALTSPATGTPPSPLSPTTNLLTPSSSYAHPGWPLPRCSRQHPDPYTRAAVFAAALLEGTALPPFKGELRVFLRRPRTPTAETSHAYAHTILSLSHTHTLSRSPSPFLPSCPFTGAELKPLLAVSGSVAARPEMRSVARVGELVGVLVRLQADSAAALVRLWRERGAEVLLTEVGMWVAKPNHGRLALLWPRMVAEVLRGAVGMEGVAEGEEAEEEQPKTKKAASGPSGELSVDLKKKSLTKGSSGRAAQR
jgi:hypothetical protein